MSLVKFLLHLCEAMTNLLGVSMKYIVVILDIRCKIIIDLNLDIVSSNPHPVYWQAWLVKLSFLLSWPGRYDSCGRLFCWANFLSAVLKLCCFFLLALPQPCLKTCGRRHYWPPCQVILGTVLCTSSCVFSLFSFFFFIERYLPCL